MQRHRIRRPHQSVPSGQQRGFSFVGDFGSARPPAPGELRSHVVAAFEEGARGQLLVGGTPLAKYLAEHELGWVLQVEEAIAALDLMPFIKAYKPTGRRAIHPRAILGLIVYGMLTRQWSLRELQSLAVRDVAAWWFTGGLLPDHSTVGKFIVLHAATLTEDFFLRVTRSVLARLNVKRGDGAIDGTVIEAVASRLHTLKLEAAREAAKDARAQADENPQDQAAQEQAEMARRVEQVAEERTAKRAKAGKRGVGVQVSPGEPDAVLQPLKSGAMRPAYKPSVLANSGRLIIGQTVEPSNELAAVPALMAQHRAIFGSDPVTTMLDAGYHDINLLRTFSDAGLDVLCPAGKAWSPDEFGKKADSKKFGKTRFTYDEKNNCMLCPAGQVLRSQGTERDRFGRAFSCYRAYKTVCAGCPKRSRCTSNKKSRVVKRYVGEEYKEAMAEVFQQEAARAKYTARQAMVEPVFAMLRGSQGLNRFHRRGMVGVGVEFALHCAAYNLRRGARCRARGAVGVAGRRRRPSLPGRSGPDSRRHGWVVPHRVVPHPHLRAPSAESIIDSLLVERG